MIKMKKDMIDKLGEIEKAMVIARTRSSEEKKKIQEGTDLLHDDSVNKTNNGDFSKASRIIKENSQ